MNEIDAKIKTAIFSLTQSGSLYYYSW